MKLGPRTFQLSEKKLVPENKDLLLAAPCKNLHWETITVITCLGTLLVFVLYFLLV